MTDTKLTGREALEFESWLLDQIECVENRINRGKGMWPQQDYVRDEQWAMWQSERLTFTRVANKLAEIKRIGNGAVK